MHSWLVGLGLGFFVALQVGPMSLFLVRSTLRGGLRTGLAIGLGIATIDGLYAAVGAAGVAPLLSLQPVRVALGAVGACVLIVIGLRNLWSAFALRLGAETSAEIATPRRALIASLAGTASNPSTIVSWAAIFAAASTAGAAKGDAGAALLVSGVAIGSLAWVSVLSAGTAVLRRAAGARAVRLADAVSGLAMLGFGAVLARETAHAR
jgi:putative LysE/RhtB family amino acid efflux pump